MSVARILMPRSAPGSPPARSIWAGSRRSLPVFVLSVVLFVALTLTQSGFGTTANLKNLLTSVSVLFVIAVGMTFVVITAGADLSVSAVAALTGIFFAKTVGSGIPGWPAVLLTVLFGTVIGGTVGGLLIGHYGLSFFVVTLASMTALTGLVNLWTGTQSFIVDSPVVAQLGVNQYAGLPAPIWIMIVVFLVALYVQRYTFFGRDVYAVGGSVTAAKLSGIRTTRTFVAVYAVSALCATIGGLITIGRVGVAAPNVDANLPLAAIAAVLLGGTALSGGVGGVGGTAIGVLFIGILQNGLSIAGVPSFWQQVVTGIILVFAVLGDRASLSALLRRRRRPSSREDAGPAGEVPATS